MTSEITLKENNCGFKISYFFRIACEGANGVRKLKQLTAKAVKNAERGFVK